MKRNSLHPNIFLVRNQVCFLHLVALSLLALQSFGHWSIFCLANIIRPPAIDFYMQLLELALSTVTTTCNPDTINQGKPDGAVSSGYITLSSSLSDMVDGSVKIVKPTPPLIYILYTTWRIQLTQGLSQTPILGNLLPKNRSSGPACPQLLLSLGRSALNIYELTVCDFQIFPVPDWG